MDLEGVGSDGWVGASEAWGKVTSQWLKWPQWVEGVAVGIREECKYERGQIWVFSKM